VYGIYIDPQKGLLVSDERVMGRNITKFPGGGLEYGEGTIECLRREMQEETSTAFEVISHFYTTDFFVESTFHTGRQIMSIYYLIKPVTEIQITIVEKPFQFNDSKDCVQSFRFIPVNEINASQFTLAIDRHVAILLRDLL
jgi:ADP-ribose pyrophosphatase YjhB (NUDIX family)